MNRRMQWHRLKNPQFQLATGVLGFCFLFTLVLSLFDEEVIYPEPFDARAVR